MQRIDPIVRTVANLIKHRGGQIGMVVTKAGVYDPETSSVSTQTMCYMPVGISLDAKESLATGSLIKVGDKQVFMKPDSNIPAPDQTSTELRIDGDNWKVYLVKPMNPSGSQVIYYEIYARR